MPLRPSTLFLFMEDGYVTDYYKLEDDIFIAIRPEYCIILKLNIPASKLGEDYPLDHNVEEAHYVSEDVGRVLLLFQGDKSLQEIIQVVKEEFSLPESNARKLVENTLEEGLDRGCLQPCAENMNTGALIDGTFKYPYPRLVTIEVTEKCNFSCPHCYLGTRSKKNFPENKIEPLANDLFEAGVRLVDLTGGEPFLYPHLSTFLETFTSNFEVVTILSNGWFIDEEMCEKLKSFPNLQVSISLHSSSSNYHDNFVNKGGAWDKAKEAINCLISKNIPVSIATTVTKQNLRDIEDILKLAKDWGCYGYRFQTIYPVGRGESFKDDLFPPTDESNTPNQVFDFVEGQKSIMREHKDFLQAESLDEIMNKMRITRNCGLGHSMWTISPTGEVRPCTMMPTDWFEIGNIFDEKPKDLCQKKITDKFAKLRAPHPDICQDCRYVDFCQGCVLRGLLMSDRTEICNWKNKEIDGVLEYDDKSRKGEGCPDCHV